MAFGSAAWWKRWRGTLAAVAVVAATACASPTLPLPPPTVPSALPAGEGRYTLRAVRGVEPNAVVVIYNNNTALSLSERAEATVADGEGTWEETITAYPGDLIDVTQEFGTTRSAPVTFRIPVPPAEAQPEP